MTNTTNIRHIVLVEDSADDHDTVREAMHLFGLPTRLSRVSNGDECMALLLRQADGERPALVLMDLNTVSTDGRESLRLIKADPMLQAIPVVIVTASANPRDVNFCYQCGANAYHVKPVRYPEHLQMLAGLLKYWLVDVTTPTAPANSP
ncbi:MAG: response regulator [Rubrivivax sp.]|nr:response regulator [Rubrivivax sp.]